MTVRKRDHLRTVDELLTYRGRRLDAGTGEFHQAVDLLLADTVPQSYWEKAKAGRAERGAPHRQDARQAKQDRMG